MKLLFYCSYSKNASTVRWHFSSLEVRVNTFSFALGVHPTARDTGEGRGSDIVSQGTPFTVSCKTRSVHVPLPHKSSIAKPCKMSLSCLGIETVQKTKGKLQDQLRNYWSHFVHVLLHVYSQFHTEGGGWNPPPATISPRKS